MASDVKKGYNFTHMIKYGNGSSNNLSKLIEKPVLNIVRKFANIWLLGIEVLEWSNFDITGFLKSWWK